MPDRRKLAVSLVFIVPALLIIASFFAFKKFTLNNISPRKDEGRNAPVNVSPAVSNKTIPPLYPEVTWGEPQSVDSNDGTYLVFVDASYLSLDGSRWTAKITPEEYEAKFDAFKKFYDESLLQIGWKKDNLEVDGHNISTEYEEDSRGSSMGYLKQEDEKIKIIILSLYKLEDEDTYEFDVFSGNPINKSELKNISPS